MVNATTCTLVPDPASFLTHRQMGSTLEPVGITSKIDDRGIAEVVMDCPPVNALTVAEWCTTALFP